MKKTVLFAIIGIFLVCAVAVFAHSQWGYTQYGAVYIQGDPFFYYLPVEHAYYYPYSGYYGSYSYVPEYQSPLSSEYMYRYGFPASITSSEIRPGTLGQLCGLVNGQQFGCVYGLLCDYSKTETPQVGVCS